jgi:predicted transcriptional regulator
LPNQLAQSAAAVDAFYLQNGKEMRKEELDLMARMNDEFAECCKRLEELDRRIEKLEKVMLLLERKLSETQDKISEPS